MVFNILDYLCATDQHNGSHATRYVRTRPALQRLWSGCTTQRVGGAECRRCVGGPWLENNALALPYCTRLRRRHFELESSIVEVHSGRSNGVYNRSRFRLAAFNNTVMSARGWKTQPATSYYFQRERFSARHVILCPALSTSNALCTLCDGHT